MVSAPPLRIPAPAQAGAGSQVRELCRTVSHFYHSRSFQVVQLPDRIPLPPSSCSFLTAASCGSTNRCHGGLGKVGNHHRWASQHPGLGTLKPFFKAPEMTAGILAVRTQELHERLLGTAPRQQCSRSIYCMTI